MKYLTIKRLETGSIIKTVLIMLAILLITLAIGFHVTFA